jgi:hypothetical protein
VSEYWQQRIKDSKIATWMGWIGVGKRMVTETGRIEPSEKWMGLRNTTDMTVTDVPNYCTRWSDWMPVEQRINDQGIWREYLAALTDHPAISGMTTGLAWDKIVMSTQEQRVDALIEALNL